MLKSILLVLDDQGADHGSIDLGIRWSLEFEALLVGLGVVDERAVNPAEPVPLGAGDAKQELDAARLHERQVAIESVLSAIALRCARSQAAFKPLEGIGSLAEEILVEAQRFDLVLMPRCLDKQSGTGEWDVSDALRTILRSAPRPVVAAPEKAPARKAIIIAYDGSLQAARMVYALAASGLAAYSACCACHVAQTCLGGLRCQCLGDSASRSCIGVRRGRRGHSDWFGGHFHRRDAGRTLNVPAGGGHHLSRCQDRRL